MTSFNRSILAAAVIAAGLAAPALAQYDETRIRTAASQTQVEGHINQPLLFTVTGYLTDVASVQICTGQTAFSGTLSSLRTSPFVYEIVNHSGGQTSLRFCFPSAQAAFGGGTVTVQRGATIIDRDRIVLR